MYIEEEELKKSADQKLDLLIKKNKELEKLMKQLYSELQNIKEELSYNNSNNSKNENQNVYKLTNRR